MKLLTFRQEGALRLGLRVEDGVLDVALAGAGRPGIPTSLDAVIRGGEAALQALRTLAAQPPAVEGWLLDEGRLEFGPCVGEPQKLLCVGLNYRQHAHEAGMAVPTDPILFSKFNNALAAAGDPVSLPQGAVQYDYEAELGVVLGREARNVTVDRALECVFGYFTANDLSARDLQFRSSQWLLGKTLDGFLPAGPYLVTADEIADPQKLGVRCWVNGELRQDSTTADMVFSVAGIISYASRYMTLKPGDVISTGTPQGVIQGMKEKTWLKPGDEVAVEVEGLGRCVNRLAA